MSIIGSFVGALVALGFRAKPGEDEALLARIDELTRERDRQYYENVVQITKYAALERERDLWRDEALRLRHSQPLPMGGQQAMNDWRRLGQAAQNVLGQNYEQMAACYQWLLAAQSQMNWPQDGRCDCSPSRSRAIIGP